MKRLDPAIIDYYDQEVVKMIAEKYGYSPMDALRQFVFSKTHELLEDEETGMTSFGAGAVFDMISGKQKKLQATPEIRSTSGRNENVCGNVFFIYLLEQYAAYRKAKTGDILREWDQKQVTQTIFDNYWGYHTERIENAFQDIDSRLQTGKSAW